MSATMDELMDDLKTRANRDGKLIMIDDNLTTANFPDTTIRDGLVVLRQVEDLGFSAEGWVHVSEVFDKMTQLGYVPATPTELAHFACTGWDMKSRVAALDSTWIDEARREAAKTYYDVVDYDFYYGVLGVSPSHKRYWVHLDFSKDFWDREVMFLAVPANPKEGTS